jgi:tetratricopeptide (TPR) repeat protein
MVPTYLFQHNLLHQVVYQSLTYARRQTLHANIAELIIRDSGELLPTQYPILAYHFSQTDQHRDGLKYAFLAAEDAETAYNYRGAADFYKQAAHHLDSLGEKGSWETAVTIAEARSKILVRLGQFAQAWELANEALQVCLNHEGLPQTLSLYNLMAEIRWRQARYNEVAALVGKVINSLLPATPPEMVGEAYLLWGRAFAALGDFAAAIDRLMQAETIFREIERPKMLAQVVLYLADYYSHQQSDSAALNLVQQAEKLLQDESDPALLGQKEWVLSRIQLRLGQAKLALAAAETAVVNLRSAGANNLVYALIQCAEAHIYLGQYSASITYLKRANNLLGGMDDVTGQLKLHLLWSVGYHGGLGDWRQAQQRLSQVRQLLVDRSGDKDVVTEADIQLWLGLGRVALNTERWQEAESLIKRVHTAVTPQRLIWWRPAALYAWGMLLLVRASEDKRETAVTQAHQSFREGLQAVEIGGCPDELPLILLQLGLTAQEMGDDRCWHYLETAVQAAQQRARHADRLFVLHEAGQALLKAPDAHLQQLGHETLAQLA